MAHELFTELDEICVKEGKDAEWKETARSGRDIGVCVYVRLVRIPTLL